MAQFADVYRCAGNLQFKWNCTFLLSVLLEVVKANQINYFCNCVSFVIMLYYHSCFVICDIKCFLSFVTETLPFSLKNIYCCLLFVIL